MAARLDPPPDFRTLFQRDPDVSAEAHGRVNLIGEHTDYNGGLVLPVLVPQRTRVELARRDDGRVRVWSAGFSAGTAPAGFDLGDETPGRGWLDYVQGVTTVLRPLGPLGGADLRLASDVPAGAGLASSAALMVALLRAMRDAWRLDLDDVTLAKAAQRAEREFVGAPVGIMDQMAASLGRVGAALLIDTRTLDAAIVPLPPDGELVVIDSGVTHRHAAGEYRTRRAECERAASLLGVEDLGRLTRDDLPRLRVLPPPLDRRARHVVTDSARVRDTADALRSEDLVGVGALFAASHASMRDDFEISTPEIDALVEAASADADVFGARLTGGGFGGAIVALARAGSAGAAAKRIVRAYGARVGRQAVALVPRPETSGDLGH